VLPDLESLRCFEAAARHPSFRAAASSVALSPAAFSERIRGLEDQLGAQLFDRGPRHLRLTAAGERLLPHARKVLAEAWRCAEVATGSDPAFELMLGTRYELGLSWLVPALSPLSRSRPQRSLDLYFGNTEHLLQALDSGRVDAVVGSMRLTRPGLRIALLHEETYRLVAAPGGDRSVLLDTSRDLPLYRYWQDAQPDVHWDRLECLSTIGALRIRALDGAGVCVLPEYFIRQDLAEGRLELLSEAPLRSDWFRLFWLEGHPRDAELVELGQELAGLPLA
jgi:LysR family glycine cleavage system transcriptional activator